jgi:DNA invertase Pin-like site-specific DNA recombinase
MEAIQAGAISNNRLEDILKNADIDKVRELATPRAKVMMTNVKVSRAKRMLDDGYTSAEIADSLGVSVSTLQRALSPTG